MISKDQTSGAFITTKPIDETELCSKIQKLMSNIKHHYGKDRPAHGDVNSTRHGQTKSPYSTTNTSTSFIETSSEMDSGEVTSSSTFTNENKIHSKDYCGKDWPVDQIEDNLLLKNKWKSKFSKSHRNKDNKYLNLIPQRTLQKIMALEQLIFNIDESMEDRQFPNDNIKRKISNLIVEFKDVKIKLVKGTQNKLMESEVVELMKQLKCLFDNFYHVQKEFNIIKSLETGSNGSSSQINFQLVNRIQPVIPPRRFGRLQLLKERKLISNITSSSEDLLSLSHPINSNKVKFDNFITNKPNKYNIYKNISTSQEINKEQNQILFEQLNRKSNGLKYSQNKDKPIEALKLEKEQYSAKSMEETLFVPNKFVNLQSFFTGKSNTMTGNQFNDKVEKLYEFKSLIDDTSIPGIYKSNLPNRLSKSVNCLAQQDTWQHKSSKLPVLKKEAVDIHAIDKITKISCMSQTVTNQVINNLKRLGYMEENYEKYDSEISKSKQSKKLTKMKTTDDILKSCAESLYLTKLNSFSLNHLSRSGLTFQNHNGSNSKIYCLETLLKKKKYKFVDENKLQTSQEFNLLKQDYVGGNSMVQTDSYAKKDIDLEMLLSLAGNSIKIVHQLIFFPAESIEMSSSYHLIKNPRLANIENWCSCKITILTTKENIKRKIRPIKGLKVFEIHYNLRKGKALGCLNMLRNLAGSLNKDMKIYRSSILLPGGYLKEMSSCGFNELLDLSMQMNENIKYCPSKVKKDVKRSTSNKRKLAKNIDIKAAITKEKPRIRKASSMNCITSS